MSDKENQTQDEDAQLQNPVVHEGAEPDPLYDGNENADERAHIVQPDGSDAPRAS